MLWGKRDKRHKKRCKHENLWIFRRGDMYQTRPRYGETPCGSLWLYICKEHIQQVSNNWMCWKSEIIWETQKQGVSQDVHMVMIAHQWLQDGASSHKTMVIHYLKKRLSTTRDMIRT